MDKKPLTPTHVKQFSKALQDAGVKSSALEIFFDSITNLIDPYEHNVSQNIEKIVKDCQFSSLDDINAFLMKYNDFTNSAISFINSYEMIEDDDDFEVKVQPLFDALFLDDEDSYEILLNSIDQVIQRMISVYEIDESTLLNVDKLETVLGKDLASILSVMIMISVTMHEGEVEKDDFVTLKANFLLLCSCIYVLDGARRDALDRIDEDSHFVARSEQESVKKVGRNDPCPCGSGKKYKKCCMHKQDVKVENPLDKLEIPMATHFPLSEKDINDFYAIWTRLMDFASRLLSEMSGQKYKKIYKKSSDGRYHFDDEVVENNYILQIRGFLLDNFERIVDNFIASNRVSKANQEILQEWKRYRLYSDNFFIYEGVALGALVWDVDGDSYYYVYDLHDSLFDLSVQDTMLSILLLPFKGRVIYDGLIATSNMDLGQNTKDMFLRDYIALREKKEVAASLPFVGSASKIYQLKISIKGAKPPIWRRVLVEDDMTYRSIHMIIQDIFDWYDGHLHEFDVYGKRYSNPEFDDGFTEDLCEDENKFVISEDLTDIGDKITYTYDFGDDWVHVIELEDILEKEDDIYYPRCIKGKGRGPLEDIGGIWAYNTLVQAYKEGDQETLDEFYVDDDFDPAEFDLKEINIILGM